MEAVADFLSGIMPVSDGFQGAGVGARLADVDSGPGKIRLSTDSAGLVDRAKWWQEQFDQHFGLECAMEPVPGHHIEVDLTLTAFGAMTLVESSGGPLRLRYRGNPGAGKVFLQFQQAGSWHMSGPAAAGGSCESAPGCLVLVHARDDASYVASGPFRQVAVMLDEAALAELCPRWPRFAFRPIPVDRGLAVMLRAHILSLAAHLGEMDSRSATALASPTLALIAAWLNSLDCEPHADIPGLPDFHRRRVKEFVINNLCDPTLNVDMIAKAVGLSVRYLHKLFENERLGLMRWAAARRLEYCRDRLSDPRLRNRSISDIAYEAGFNDLAHFSRSFRKSFNTSPSQARGASAC